MNPRFFSQPHLNKKSIFPRSESLSPLPIHLPVIEAHRDQQPVFEHNMVGESREMFEIYKLLSKVASTDSTVLIQGESGTGKELAARALHRNSCRRHQPFVAVNCAAIPEGLLESELFGHERGAFTGAQALHKGRMELADGGTIFLDEVGELSLGMQAKLLRFLQERSFERVGGVESILVNVRFLAATNQDLHGQMRSSNFRKDLFYRLNVVSVTMPPLRERRSDIPRLAEYFVIKHEKKVQLTGKRISPSALDALKGYDWPGNVRELENVIERALILSSSASVELRDLPTCVRHGSAPLELSSRNYHEAIRFFKKQLIFKALVDARGSYTKAAHTLGLQANYLHRLVRNLGLKNAIEHSVSSLAVTPPHGSDQGA